MLLGHFHSKASLASCLPCVLTHAPNANSKCTNAPVIERAECSRNVQLVVFLPCRARRGCETSVINVLNETCTARLKNDACCATLTQTCACSMKMHQSNLLSGFSTPALVLSDVGDWRGKQSNHRSVYQRSYHILWRMYHNIPVLERAAVNTLAPFCVCICVCVCVVGRGREEMFLEIMF